MGGKISPEDLVRLALKDVNDPEMPISLVDMGMVYGVTVNEKERAVKIRLGLTATACPAMDFIQQDVTERLRQEGFQRIDVEWVWDPPWTKDRISEKGRLILSTWGVSV
jgi:metal-sulfur cluster biosynthetic enzyme